MKAISNDIDTLVSGRGHQQIDHRNIAERGGRSVVLIITTKSPQMLFLVLRISAKSLRGISCPDGPGLS